MLDMMLIAHNQAPEVLQPRVGSLNHPSVSIFPELSSILMRCDGVVLPAWDTRFNGAGDQQRPRPIAVISAVGNQACRRVKCQSAPPSFCSTRRPAACAFAVQAGPRLHAAGACGDCRACSRGGSLPTGTPSPRILRAEYPGHLPEP